MADARPAIGRTRWWWARRSLRARLTAAATAIIVAGVVGAALLLIYQHRNALRANLDAAVSGQVQTVAADAAHGQLPHPLPAARGGAAAVQVVAADGAVVTSSANLNGRERLFAFPGGRDRPSLATVPGVQVGNDNITYRVAALTTSTPSGPMTVYAGLPTNGVNESVAELAGALAVGVPVAVVVMAVVGWLLVGRALRPVDAMRRQAAAISGTDLHQRLDPPPADDELGRLAVTLNDLLARIEAATNRQRLFIADAAHELRSPLSALSAELEIAGRRAGPVISDTIIANVRSDVARLSRLVDDLLALARLDANPHPRRQPVDLDDLVLDEARRARGRGPGIDTTAVQAAQMYGDPQALSRVVQNLVDNAVRYAATTVVLKLAATDATAMFTVADDGPGIPAADRQRVFERFTRLDGARSRDAGGSGLGLAIVRDVVTAHGGQVRIEDNEPGVRITVTFPLGE